MKVVSFLLRRCQKMSMVQKLCLAQMALPIELIIKCSKFLNIKRLTNYAPHNGLLLSTLLYRYTIKCTSWKRCNPNLLGWCITHCMFLIWRFWYKASGLLRIKRLACIMNTYENYKGLKGAQRWLNDCGKYSMIIQIYVLLCAFILSRRLICQSSGYWKVAPFVFFIKLRVVRYHGFCFWNI